MRSKTIFKMLLAICTFCLLLVHSGKSFAQEYEALKGVQNVKTIFDFRFSKPGDALTHLQLIYDTYQDQAIRQIAPEPDFVVIFMAGSVLLLTDDREGYSAADKKRLQTMDELLFTMDQAGIKLEVCLFATKTFGIDPQSFPTEIEPVDNGWIASIGYQAKGYNLIPAF